MIKILTKIKKFLKKFIKDHLIDGVHPDDPNF